MRSHVALVVAVALAFAAGLYTSSGSAVAQEAPPSAVCIQVPQRPDRTSHEALAGWMNQQLAAGRTQFESVTGLSTLMCAW